MWEANMDLIIRQVKLIDKDRLLDIGIKDGKFNKMSEKINFKGEREINANGNLLSPPFVESHVHLDGALTAGQPRSNKSGTLLEAIEIAAERKQQLTKKDVKKTAKEVITWLISNGVLKIRAHTDFTPTTDTFEAIMELKEELASYVDIQVVAFPQDGLFNETDTAEKFEFLIKEGADVIGGLPQAELTREDGIRSIEYIFDLAEKYNRLIDIHTDESGDDHSRFLEVITKYAIKTGMKERVTASHTTAMHNYHNDYASKIIQNIKKAHMNIVANPFSNSLLQNRFDHYPKGRGITRIDELRAAGVNVSLGNDNIVDPFGPMGKGSMLQAAQLLVYTAHLSNEEQIKDLFQMITTNGAKTLNDSSYGIKVGKNADCILLDAKNEKEAIRLASECLYVIRNGKIIVETKPAIRTLQLNNETIQVDFKLE